MALADLRSSIWSARFKNRLDAATIWPGLCNRNYEGEIRAGHTTVKIPTYTGAVTVKDYTANQDIAATQLANATSEDFTITQQRYFNIEVDDIQELQSRPDLLDAHLQEAAVTMAADINSYVFGKFNAVAPGNSRTTAIANLKGGTEPLRTAAAKAIIEGLSDMKLQMFENNFIQVNQPWVVMSPVLYTLVEKYITVNTSVDYGGATGAALTAGFAGNLVGFNIIVDNNIAERAGVFKCIVGTNQATTYAEQLVEIVPYRPERRFSDAVKALYVYDAAVVDPRYIYNFNVTYAANAAS